MEGVKIRHLSISAICIGILTTVSAQRCSLNMTSLELQSDFNFDKFMGRWYEIKAWFHSGINEEELMHDYSFQFTKSSPGIADVLEMGRMNGSECEFWTGEADKLQLIAGSERYPARLGFRTIYNTPLDTPPEDKAFYVIFTDYDNYALTVTCTWNNQLYANGTCLPDPIVHVLSRATTLSAVDEGLLDTIVDRAICHADLDDFRSNVHSSNPCQLPTGESSVFTLSLWLFSLVVLIHVDIFKTF